MWINMLGPHSQTPSHIFFITTHDPSAPQPSARRGTHPARSRPRKGSPSNEGAPPPSTAPHYRKRAAPRETSLAIIRANIPATHRPGASTLKKREKKKKNMERPGAFMVVDWFSLLQTSKEAPYLWSGLFSFCPVFFFSAGLARVAGASDRKKNRHLAPKDYRALTKYVCSY